MQEEFQDPQAQGQAIQKKKDNHTKLHGRGRNTHSCHLTFRMYFSEEKKILIMW
jgi:hypothetical protein